MTLTDADLARLEALDKAATEGPWTLATRGSSYAKCPQCDQGEYIARALPSTYGPENHNTEADAALIVEFRNRTPDLVAELREARAALARVRALHQPVDAEVNADEYCIECSAWWPCPTLRAIGGCLR